MLFVSRNLRWRICLVVFLGHHMDWCCINSRGASGGILLMRDRRVVEKINECVEEFTVACSFRMLKIISPGILQAFMALILTGI